MADPGARLSPFALAMGPFATDRLGEVHRALAEAEVDAFDRDAWALSRAGAELLHDLRPEAGLGDAAAGFVALAHAAFLFWQQGQHVVTLSRPELDGLAGGDHVGPPSAGGPRAYYLQLPPRRVWGTPLVGAAPEPLDGWFALTGPGQLALVAVFGLLPGRPGFTVSLAEGPPPGPLAREDGSALFASTLEGGEVAGLWSIQGPAELLELGWRVHRLVENRGGPGHSEDRAS